MEYTLREKRGWLKMEKSVKCRVTACTILPHFERDCLLMHFTVLLTLLFDAALGSSSETLTEYTPH